LYIVIGTFDNNTTSTLKEGSTLTYRSILGRAGPINKIPNKPQHHKNCTTTRSLDDGRDVILKIAVPKPNLDVDSADRGSRERVRE
jgi:hypothetical protein